MINGDLIALVVLETFLCLLVVCAIAQTVVSQIKNRRTNLSLVVNRGPQSMKNIHTWFAITSILFTLTIEVADALNGFKAVLVLVNYGLLLYLFFFNSWFRNRILIPLNNRTQRD